jgi:hypothetical protein
MQNTPKPRLFARLAESLGMTETVEKNDDDTCRERLRSADWETVVTLAGGGRLVSAHPPLRSAQGREKERTP